MKHFFTGLLVLLLGITTAACAETAANPGSPVLSRFFLSRGGSMVPQSYEILLGADGYSIQENDDEPRAFRPDLAEALLQILRENQVNTWDGFHETNPYVLDGEMFSLALEYMDGTLVSAFGSNAFPDHYHQVMDAISEILQQEKWAFLAGAYRYEGEGFGGDFILTLNADGTYTFSEGPLSSYLGMGTWDTYCNAVYMTENEESGFDLSFTFGCKKDTLVFLAAGSDAFPHISVPDEALFLRQKAEP